jgi:ATPase subunit of ABC transporter with duplicated ATPase domains
MTDYDSDAPETLSDFVDRQMRYGPHTFIPSGFTKEERSCYGESIEEAWERLEKEKAERRRTREQKLKEHERAVAQLTTQIEREKERIRREEARQREREAEREKRDPTPQVQPAATIPKIPFEIRDQHIFIPGMTRHGKSTQFFHLILDDIENDRRRY